MKSVIMATAFTAIYSGALIVILRTWELSEKAGVLTLVFASTLPAFVWAHYVVPPDIWFLPQMLTEDDPAVDLVFGLLVYLAGYFGGILQIYNLADRGLSLRMLIDIYESPNGCSGTEDIARKYSRGKGIGWMYKKRITDMLSRGLISINGSGELISITRRGEKVSILFSVLRNFLRLDS